MHRLFVAIRPPPSIRADLLAVMDGVMTARWQNDEQLHLTLRFIGAVDAHTADDVAAALATISAAPVEIAIDGVGIFDRKGRVESLWAGVRNAEPLAALHRKVDRALVSIGLDPERRAYKPHITLARFGRHGGDVGAFLTRHSGLALPRFTANAFHLFESVTHPEGADYTIVETYMLGR